MKLYWETNKKGTSAYGDLLSNIGNIHKFNEQFDDALKFYY